jgi:hypothetical protein
MSDERKERESAIRRIKALLETAGRTEAEIDACSGKVQELLVKYHLSMSDVAKAGDTIIRDTDFLTDSSEWIKSLLNGVAQLYLCGYYYETFPADWIEKHGLNDGLFPLIAGNHRTAYLRHNFIGKPVDVTVAKAMGQYIARAMQTLCREEVRKWPTKERPAFRVSFMNACTARVRYRLHQKLLEAQESGIPGTNLPAVRSLYEQAQDAARDYLRQQGILPDPKATSLANIEHQGGAVAGWKAGDRIGLDQQVGGNINPNRIGRR